MKLLGRSCACPPELLDLVESCGSFSEGFTVLKRLAIHDICCLSLVAPKGVAEQIVVKSYPKYSLSKSAREQVDREIAVHSKLTSPSVLQFYLACEDVTNVYLALEYADGGDLASWLPVVSEEQLRTTLVVPLLQALADIHEMGIVHRDIKPENVLFKEGCVKLGDFGLAVLYEDVRMVTKKLQSGGTPLYQAPEVLSAFFSNKPINAVIGPQNDVWALGVMILEAFLGAHPFDKCSGNVLFTIANHTNITLPEELSDECKDWLSRALQKDPQRRATVQDLLHHPWLLKTFEREEQDLVVEISASFSCKRAGSTCSLQSSSSTTSARSNVLLYVDQDSWEF